MEWLKKLFNVKAVVMAVFSEKLVGTALRHGLNAAGVFLTTAAGLAPELVQRWVDVNYAVGLACSMVLVAFLGSRLNP